MGLDVKNLQVSLSGNTIVHDVSMRVRDNQFVGLLGPNGCGKTTMLRTVYKSIKPDHGGVLLDKLDVLSASPKEVARRLSVVGQFNELSFDFSVRQLVLMGRTPFKKMMEPDNKEDIAIADKAITAVGLNGYENRSYATLSGGEKQRVILAKAITQHPTFMCLDEPTNHLDINFQLKLLSVVKSLKIGILAAMHDLTLAGIFCTYIYLMQKGKVVASGTPIEVLTHDNIFTVYGVDCHVTPNHKTGYLDISYII